MAVQPLGERVIPNNSRMKNLTHCNGHPEGLFRLFHEINIYDPGAINKEHENK